MTAGMPAGAVVLGSSAAGPVVLVADPTGTAVPSTTLPGPTTTGPGAVITINGGPNATADIVGPRTDPADFFGIGLALVAIVVAVFLTRFVFRRHGRGQAPAEGVR